MPRKPKQTCAYPGCPKLSDGRYCEEHRKLMESRYNRYERSPDVHKVYGQPCGKRRPLKRIKTGNESSYIPRDLITVIFYYQISLKPLKTLGLSQVNFPLLFPLYYIVP